jgi:hypothetical protein
MAAGIVVPRNSTCRALRNALCRLRGNVLHCKGRQASALRALYSTSRPLASIWLVSVLLRAAVRRQNHFQFCLSSGATAR